MNALPDALPAEQQEEGILLREDQGTVATLTLNRPRQFNALSRAMIAELRRELHAIADDDTVRVVVLAGAGRAFCAGHDLKEMRAHAGREAHEETFDQCSAMMMALVGLPQPVIAKVHGIATAAGCQLVGMCDLAVAATDARFAVSGVNLGLFCSTPGVALSRNVSRKRAMEMLLTGDFISAQTAMEYGLVNRVAAPAELDRVTLALAAAVAAKPRDAVRLGKQLFYRQVEQTMPDAYHAAARVMAGNMMCGDTLEGVDAFIEKRKPNWR